MLGEVLQEIYDNINNAKRYVLMFEAGRGFGGNGRDSVGEKKVSDTRLKGPLSAKAAWGNPSNAFVFTRMPHFLVFSLQNCTLGFFLRSIRQNFNVLNQFPCA